MLWPREANYSRVSSLLQQDRQPGSMSPILLHFRWVEPLVPFAGNAGLTGFICVLQLLPGSEAHMPDIVKSLILPAVKLVSSTGKQLYMTPYNISQLPTADFTDLYHVRLIPACIAGPECVEQPLCMPCPFAYLCHWCMWFDILSRASASCRLYMFHHLASDIVFSSVSWHLKTTLPTTLVCW